MQAIFLVHTNVIGTTDLNKIYITYFSRYIYNSVPCSSTNCTIHMLRGNYFENTNLVHFKNKQPYRYHLAISRP